MKILHTIPLTAMHEQQQELLTLVQCGPVALVTEEQVAGVLLSPAAWAAIINALEAAQSCLAALDTSVDRKK